MYWVPSAPTASNAREGGSLSMTVMSSGLARPLFTSSGSRHFTTVPNPSNTIFRIGHSISAFGWWLVRLGLPFRPVSNIAYAIVERQQRNVVEEDHPSPENCQAIL